MNQSAPFSSAVEDDCKTGNETKNYITKQGPNTKWEQQQIMNQQQLIRSLRLSLTSLWLQLLLHVKYSSLMKVENIAECSLGAFYNTFDLH